MDQHCAKISDISPALYKLDLLSSTNEPRQTESLTELTTCVFRNASNVATVVVNNYISQ